jgi:hypothetical protein
MSLILDAATCLAKNPARLVGSHLVGCEGLPYENQQICLVPCSGRTSMINGGDVGLTPRGREPIKPASSVSVVRPARVPPRISLYRQRLSTRRGYESPSAVCGAEGRTSCRWEAMGALLRKLGNEHWLSSVKKRVCFWHVDRTTTSRCRGRGGVHDRPVWQTYSTHHQGYEGHGPSDLKGIGRTLRGPLLAVTDGTPGGLDE